ncbi:class B sortase [Muricomes intestini]|uniref:Sortase B n=1 Tax=Muricomes intestini TaxID=1796634 RepID=A0A4R3KDH0_9FIRM|nr:class B sortase [Muricomes intestini]TCS81090.1 sortase B [Muricomes intestini]HAX50767.1 SrtB family sortase [Lachnospiraceae bacterium]HCR84584.1 SrtB family sortase [Lachnospiraceae bacterium]
MGKKKKPKKSGSFGEVLSTIVLIVSVCVLVVSVYQLVMMLAPYYSGGKEYNKVKELAITGDGDNDGFQIDFDELLKMNPDTVAWLRFDAPSAISYPVVKSADNEEYLTKTFSANDNKLGAIFMDMRSSSDFSDQNTFIYGHNLQVGGEMFSQLNEYASEDFCKEHPYFYIYTPNKGKLTYQVFAAAVVNDQSENYRIEYPTEQEFADYLEMCKGSSNYQTDAKVDSGSRIVSLSTCTNVNEEDRFLLQGVLVED